MLAIEKNKLKDLLEILAREYQVMVPAKTKDASGFIPYEKTAEIMLEENTFCSPKQLFFPQTEKMYAITANRDSMEIVSASVSNEKRLLFGVRSCDLKSLECLDKVFLEKGYVDEFYKARRENTAIIALNCTRTMPNCFCYAMDVDPQNGKGADIQAYQSAELIGFEAVTEKGKKILETIKSLLSENEIQEPASLEFKLKADAEGLSEKLKSMFDSLVWEEVSRKCLNCGACSYTCPTCHCFDISQDTKGETINKFRCWDSCMFGEYTMMAGGHNPRPGKKERVRNRFLHKLNYFPERYGMLQCTGCGRCIGVCPVGMDITSVMRMIKEAE
ncbi:4Fe-4S dicluster domain-containing protein [Dehalobacter sp. DCM]|uniref:4Fe-4S dicluster domain-containing protein n=1 Tax=Dehalobacter sp. DCM TaxID=2907827 RepID=UPI003081728E|nr:4Fe-4S dicluster domain-containing protein [Dehalobacter sp. DCM]